MSLFSDDPTTDGAEPVGLEAAIVSQAELYQAQGMVKIQLDVSLHEAMARLCAYADVSDQPLAEVARQVISRQLRLDAVGEADHYA